MSSALATASPAQASTSQQQIDAAVEQIFTDSNAARAQAGLAPLKLLPSMNTVAQNWSVVMGTQQSLYHNPDFSRQIHPGWRRAGENVAYGYSPTTVTNDGWMRSSGHRDNILGNFSHIGIGYHMDSSGRGWYTQNFGLYETPNLTEIDEPTTRVTHNDFGLSWLSKWYEGVEGYKVELYSPEGTLLTTKNTTEAYVGFNGLVELTTYTVKLSSYKKDAFGVLHTSPVRTVTVTTTEEIPTVDAPQSLNSSTTDTSMTATWYAPAVSGTIQPYTVTLNQGATVIKESQTTELSAVFNNLVADTDYTVTVTAASITGNGNKATASASTTNKTQLSSVAAVSDPTGLTASSSNWHTIDMKWGAPSTKTGSHLVYRVTLSRASEPDIDFRTTDLSYSYTNVSSNATYTVKVQAEITSDDGMNSAVSNGVSTTVTTKAPPPPPPAPAPPVQPIPVQPTPPAPPTTPFVDEAHSNFPTEIRWMKTRGISTGYDDGTYRPFDAVNREAMAAFMYRMAGSPTFIPPAMSPFVDVPTNHHFYKEIAWMHSSKISTGYDDRTYRPHDNVIREAMAAFMQRYAVQTCSVNVSGNRHFVDAHTSGFSSQISWMGGVGISTGYDDGTYRPFDAVIREAMAAFMYRLNNHINLHGGCK